MLHSKADTEPKPKAFVAHLENVFAKQHEQAAEHSDIHQAQTGSAVLDEC